MLMHSFPVFRIIRHFYSANETFTTYQRMPNSKIYPSEIKILSFTLCFNFNYGFFLKFENKGKQIK